MIELERVPDWDRALSRVTEKHLHVPFVWGKSDCFQTVADAVMTVTGTDIGIGVPAYSSEQGAARVLRRLGIETVEDLLATLLPPVGRLLAQRGDVCTVARDGVVACGYVTAYGVAVKAEHGLEFLPQTDVAKAFKVG